MNIEQKLDLLKSINEVDAPPFLLTRIRGRINSLYAAPAPKNWKMAFAFTAILIVLLNAITIFSNPEQKSGTSEVKELVTNMKLSANNNLYNE